MNTEGNDVLKGYIPKKMKRKLWEIALLRIFEFTL